MRTWPRTCSGSITTAPGSSLMSCGISRYSKIRSNSANEVCTSLEICSIEPIGKKIRDCSVVNATIVPAVIALGCWTSPTDHQVRQRRHDREERAHDREERLTDHRLADREPVSRSFSSR
jgi:hypothetical protein